MWSSHSFSGVASTMANRSITLTLPHPDDTDRLGAALGQQFLRRSSLLASNGLNMRLDGTLGAGKTSLVRALIRELGWSGPVKSPTFSLVETYLLLGRPFNHFDFYRFEDPMEFEDAGFRDLFGPGMICATEWTEKAEPFVPAPDLSISLFHEGLGRRAELTAHTPAGEAVLSGLTSDGSADA